MFHRSDAVPPSPDYTVRGKFYFGAQSGTSASVGICGRMGGTSTQNFYSARMLAGTGLVLVKMVGNTLSTLATYPYTFVADTEVVAELKMVGSQISVYLDGTLVIGPISDTSLAAVGYPGIRTINASTQIQISEMSADDGVVTGGAAYTISAGPSSFDMTGSPASLRVSRKLAGGNGSFSLTGTAAALRAGRRIVGATGVITLAGAATALTASRKLAGAPGTFELTAPSASITVARGLAAAAGAFMLTGGDAQLVYSPVAEGQTIVTSAGQFVLSGAAVGMRVTRRMQAQPGSFALAGSAAEVRYANRTVAEIDATMVPIARTVTFGGCLRAVVFKGGIRTMVFAGGTRTVRF